MINRLVINGKWPIRVVYENIYSQDEDIEEIAAHLNANGIQFSQAVLKLEGLFLMPSNLLLKTQNSIENLANISVSASDITRVSMVSVIGSKVVSNNNLQDFILQQLNNEGIKFILKFTEKCKFSIVVLTEYHELVIRFLHKILNLSNESIINKYKENENKQSI